MRGRLGRSDETVRREASDWLVLVHDPEAEVDRAAFERWRAADPRHGEAYARAERAWDRAALLSDTRFGRDRRAPDRRARSPRPAWRQAAAVAAVLVIALVGLSFTRLSPLGSSDRQQVELLASRIGAIDRVALADGSTVTLDTDSAVRVAFTDGERRLQLVRGRARFDVAHDAARPFVVTAGDGSVTARGTVFDVSVVGGRVNVVLLRGAVDVRNASGASRMPAAVTRLVPGQQLLFAGRAAAARPQPLDPRLSQWPTGMLSFDAIPLSAAVADANRYNLVKISVTDPAIGALRITGAFRANDANGFAASVAASLGLTVTQTDRGIALSRHAASSTIE